MPTISCKKHLPLLLASAFFLSCQSPASSPKNTAEPLPLAGTWQLLQGTTIENDDTTVTDYTKNLSFIKIINDTHFAFLQHDLTKGKDSAAVFVAGGGTYTLQDSAYKEHLEYCSAREWEGNDFSFTVTIKNDTLVQQGVEKLESAGINRINTEKYVRVKK
ncbi:lipocalin-like domain-containing protein [Flavisolibacter sp. BT320]|nr:lipocalin-like domain-containing protein [Flavisolibacter longurius]